MSTRLTKAQLSRLDLKAALAAEVSVPGSLLPVPFLDEAVSSRQADFIRLLSSRVVAGVIGAPPEVLLAKKPRGVRPVLVIPLGARVIYRAVVDEVAKQLCRFYPRRRRLIRTAGMSHHRIGALFRQPTRRRPPHS